MDASEPQVFAPERPRLRREAVLTALGVTVATPVLLLWNGIGPGWALPIAVFVFAFTVGRDVFRARVRGRDLVLVAAEGIRVTNRRRAWLLAWPDVARVYRFQETFIFETHDHRRETLDLEGHEANVQRMVAAIGERARANDLRWFDTLAGLLG